MYQVKFISSGIVAYSSPNRALCRLWIDNNNYGEDVHPIDPDTGEVIHDQWVKGECLNLFKLERVKK